MKQIYLIVCLLLIVLLAQLAFPASVRDASTKTSDGFMEASDDCFRLIQRYEGFSSAAYLSGGRWYIGYGSQISEGAYPNGIGEQDAAALLREDLRAVEAALNRACAQAGRILTQGQFDALVDFTYTVGDSWLNGTSALAKLVRGDITLSRRETVRAFGIWSHVGGTVLPSLAQRRLEEAALYLDGDTTRADEFCWLAVKKEDGVVYDTDFAVYERSGSYDAFPVMFRLGYTPAAVRTEDGTVLRLGDRVTASRSGSVVWEKNRYVKRSYTDVVSDDWFYDYVMELSEADVIGGRGDGTYAPALPVTTGEALKLVLLAAGHPEQSAAGSHWASGYADCARERGWLPVELLAALDEPISRLDVAHLASLAIGFGQSFLTSPFSDVDDGFVTALAELGVLEGMVEDGKPVYCPDRSLTRAEVSTIVWRLRRAVSLGARQTVTQGSRALEVAPGVALNRYSKEGFSGLGREMTYTAPGVTVLRGIDVSRYQGDIDWDAVRADGIEFAILRVGGRYQDSGGLYDDSRFEEYYAGAKAAGLRIGVYFYSQAITADEAVEEADYVIEKLIKKELDGPVVFDWETAGNPNARTNSLPVSVICDCAVAYCERVRAAGYLPMIYMNTYDGYLRYDVRRLTDYDFWYAGQYGGAFPRFVYDFTMWQYTSSGKVNGIAGDVDMDLWFLR